MTDRIYEELACIAGGGHVDINVPMREETTFQVGGPADYFVRPDTKEKVAALVGYCRRKELPYLIMGNGSNMLVGDGGYRGVVIQLGEDFGQITVEKETIAACAGALLSDIAAVAADRSLTGFEFACGIPGTLGGALMMNAGAYDGEMKQVVLWADVLDADGVIRRLPAKELELGYRTSIFAKKGLVALAAGLALKPGDPGQIRGKMEDLTRRREEKQPLEYGSAGSTFKRPKGHYAGQLIQQAGMRGFRIGGAMVSEKHCGFVINAGGATARDVTDVMDAVIRKVQQTSGVTLEPEVKRIGEFL